MIDSTLKSCGQCGAELHIQKQRHCHECGGKLRILENTEVLNYGECPSCGRYSTLAVASTSRPIRYLKCRKCGSNFKTVEVFMSHPDSLLVASDIIAGIKSF